MHPGNAYELAVEWLNTVVRGPWKELCIVTDLRNEMLRDDWEPGRVWALYVMAKTTVYERERQAWIRRCGGTHLRRCIMEGIECDAIYRDCRRELEPDWEPDGVPYRVAREALENFELPGWTLATTLFDAGWQILEPRNPPDTVWALLDRARHNFPGARLCYLRPVDADSPLRAFYGARRTYLNKDAVWTEGQENQGD